MSDKWWNQPTFTVTIGNTTLYLKVWGLMVLSFVLGSVIL